MKREIRLHRNHAHLYESIADAMSHRIAEAVAARGLCRLVLAGGRTPLPLFDLLASSYRESIPWRHVHLFWGDERVVPYDHPDSNFGIALERLVRLIPVPETQIHPIPIDEEDPESAARSYENTLRSSLGPRGQFDLTLLGLGVDGHTASLFPGTQALTEMRRWVVPVTAPISPPLRLTLTLRILNRSRHVYFVAVGSDKADALKCAFGQSDPDQPCPARDVDPRHGDVVWWVDVDAADGL